MFKIFPTIDIKPSDYLPLPPLDTILEQIAWQGIHVCGIALTPGNEKILFDLPVCEGAFTPAAYNTHSRTIYSHFHKGFNWYTNVLKEMAERPDFKDVKLDIEQRNLPAPKKIVILNTLDAWYGHSLISLFHLHRLLKSLGEDIGIVVLIQPFLKWLVPRKGVYEVWTAALRLSEGKKYYPKLNERIMEQFIRFEEVYISETPVQSDGFDITMFTGEPVFGHERFGLKGNRFSFIWREDVSRLWARNYYVYGGLKILKLQRWLLPLQKRRVLALLLKLRKAWGEDVVFTVVGLGTYGKFPAWIRDERVNQFDDALEKRLCRIYSESEIVAGIHGSHMILPSAHAGMTLSLMPSKRWGNFAEDIVFHEEKTHECLFKKRVIPLNLPVSELADICISMRAGIKQFLNKLQGTYGERL